MWRYRRIFERMHDDVAFWTASPERLVSTAAVLALAGAHSAQNVRCFDTFVFTQSYRTDATGAHSRTR